MNNEVIENCEEKISHTKIVLKENKSEYRAINQNRTSVSKYKVDGCIYESSSDHTRCDYLLKVSESLYFIELKGVDVQKGIGQVLKSIQNLKQYFDHNVIYARIITTRGTGPKRLNTYREYRDLLKLISRERVILSNTPFSEPIN